MIAIATRHHGKASLTLAAVLTCMSFGVVTAAAEDLKFRFKAEGAYAEAWLTEGCVYGYVWVSRGGPVTAPETYLNYGVYDGCTGGLLAEGWGPVANSVFKTTTKGARLRLQVGVSEAFSTLGEIGLIDVVWVADRTVITKSDSRYEFRSPTLKYRQRGRYEQHLATAKGALIVITSGIGSGAVGTARELVREQIR